MRFLHLKTIFVLLVALVLASGSSVNAQALMKAQENAYDNETERQRRDKQKTRTAQAVSKKVYERIIKAQEAVDLEDYPEALRILNNLYSISKLSDYEQQNVLNYLGFIYYSMDDMTNAMNSYELMLAIPTLEEQIKKTTVYTLAQLNTMQENYSKAIRLTEEFFRLETNPAADPYIFYAQILYQMDRYSDMIEPVETAMEIYVRRQTARRLAAKVQAEKAFSEASEKAEKAFSKASEEEIAVARTALAVARTALAEANKSNNITPVPKEDWYVLLNFAYFQQENFIKVRDIQKTLLVHWPKKQYWFSLAGAFTELGEDENLIYAYDAAHTQKLLEKESELVTMAQLYMQAEVPYKAAKLLDKEIKAKRVEKNEKNYRLMSQAWTLAAEDEAAIPALKQAARLSEEGELDLRLGNAYLNIGEHDECAKAITNGIKKGGIKSPDNAQISLGMCLYNLKEYKKAISAFKKASKTRRSRRVSNQWIRVIESDIERERQITLAEAAAQKQLKELEKRRRQSKRI
jgi:tetratricopeptide (TPR) repeat protein